jgi:hypothetical protein
MTIFHFGTGAHHIVGLENHKFSNPNEIIGITASVPEHQEYVRLVLEEPAIAKYYKVIFADIYTLTSSCLPTFNIVTLFHLSEYYLPDNPDVHHDDKSLLELFINKLNPWGKIIIANKRNHWSWEKTLPIIQEFEAKGILEKVDEYKNLLIFSN